MSAPFLTADRLAELEKQSQGSYVVRVDIRELAEFCAAVRKVEDAVAVLDRVVDHITFTSEAVEIRELLERLR